MVANEHIGKPRSSTVVVRPAKKPYARRSRPLSPSPRIEAVIFGRLAQGRSIRRICQRRYLPALNTVFDWLKADDTFAKQYAHARDAQVDTYAEEIIDIADDARGLDSDGIAAARLRMEARKWVAAKLKPKKYGDRPDEHHITTIVNNVMPIARQRELQERRQAALAGRVSEA